MRVTIAKSSGFCRGVQRAVDTAMRIPPENTYILGELIHNPVVTEAVAARGIVRADTVGEVPDGATLILRSHGAGEAVYVGDTAYDSQCARGAGVDFGLAAWGGGVDVAVEARYVFRSPADVLAALTGGRGAGLG